MLGKPGATIPLISTTADPTTGSGLDPTALTWTVFRNGVDITASSAVSANTDLGAGINKATFTIPVGSAEGDQIQVVETATVNSIAASRENCRLTVVSRLPGELSTYSGADPAGVTTLLSRIASALTITGGKVDINDKTGFSVTGDLSATMKTSVEAAVWDAVATSHNSAGTLGNKVNSAASAGDPWTTALPGAYAAGSAGNILGNRLVGTLASGTHNPQSGDSFARIGAPAGASVSADLAAVNAKTVNLPASPASTTNITAASGVTLTSAYDAAKTAAPATALTAIPGAVWDEAAASHVASGSFGYYLKRIFGWFFWRKDVTPTQIKTYDSDSSTVVGTQSISGDGSTSSSVGKSI